MAWSVYALACATHRNPTSENIREAFSDAVNWCLAMQATNGAAWAGVRNADEGERVLDKRTASGVTALFAAALARSSAELSGGRRLAVLTAAENAYVSIAQEASTPERLWAVAELFRVTGDPVYMEVMKEDISSIPLNAPPATRVSQFALLAASRAAPDEDAWAEAAGRTAEELTQNPPSGVELTEIAESLALPCLLQDRR